MYKHLGAIAVAAVLAAPVSAATMLDLSNGSFDPGTDTFTFSDVIAGVDLIINPINGTVLDSRTEVLNGTIFDGSGGSGGRINMRAAPPAGVNTVDLRFAFIDNVGGSPVVIPDLELGFYDLDGFTGEILQTITPAAVTVTTSSLLTVTPSVGTTKIESADVYNVENVTDFNNLTNEQEDAGLVLAYGDRSFFDLRLTVTPESLNQRNFEFGNANFKQDTITVPAPVPLPAPVLMLGTAIAGLGAVRRARRNA